MKPVVLAASLWLSFSTLAFGFDFNTLLKDKAEAVLKGVASGDITSIDSAIDAALPSISEVSESFTRQTVDSPDEITMYVTPTCGYCIQAEEYMNERAIRYNRKDVTTSDAAMKDFRRLGGKGVPLIIMGNEQMAGFEPGRFEQMRRRNGL